MKKLIFFSILLLSLGLSSAKAMVNTRLQVASFDNALIQVYVDGVSYGDYSTSQVVENLAPGEHQLEVIGLYTDPNSNENYETTLFFGNVVINDGYELVTVVNANNQLQVANQVPLYPREHYRTVVVFKPFVVFGGVFRGRYYHAPVVIYHGPVEHRYIHYAPRPVYHPHPVYHHAPRHVSHSAPAPFPVPHPQHRAPAPKAQPQHHEEHHGNAPHNAPHSSPQSKPNNNVHHGPRK